MRHPLLRALMLGMALVAVLALGACGDDESSDSRHARPHRPSSRPPTAPPEGAQEGGELTVLATADVDYIDPGAQYAN